MSKYFAKYLPVEEEIKVGDKYICLSNGLICEALSNIIFYINNEHHKKVKLFLCSKDIQMGDKVYHDYMKYLTKDSQLEIVEDDEDLEFLMIHSAYKVLGEISSEANWVKEGDEFDDDEIGFGSDTGDPNLLPISIKDLKRDYIETGDKFKYPIGTYYILGPCKHFH